MSGDEQNACENVGEQKLELESQARDAGRGRGDGTMTELRKKRDAHVERLAGLRQSDVGHRHRSSGSFVASKTLQFGGQSSLALRFGTLPELVGESGEVLSELLLERDVFGLSIVLDVGAVLFLLPEREGRGNQLLEVRRSSGLYIIVGVIR
jgi:hypothetical protein